MSETTSFLGGAALAGLAAVILLKGGVATPSMQSSQPLPNFAYPTVSPTPTFPPTTTGTPTTSTDIEKYRLETEQLKALLEQQRVQTEQVRAQLQSQQALIETLNAQSKSAAAKPPASAETANPLLSGLMWALGGIILTFGGGIALVGMFVLFARPSRPSRTIEVIHDQYPDYMPTRRRSQMLPARRIRRVEAEDLD